MYVCVTNNRESAKCKAVMDNHLCMASFPEKSGRLNLDLLVPVCIIDQQESPKRKAMMDTYVCIVSFSDQSGRQNFGYFDACLGHKSMAICET